jgi:hypothetical protein
MKEEKGMQGGGGECMMTNKVAGTARDGDDERVRDMQWVM